MTKKTTHNNLAQFLTYQWTHANDERWTCMTRGFDDTNDNAGVLLSIPWIKWPEDDREPRDVPWREICRSAEDAVDYWYEVVHWKTKKENFPQHQFITCVFQMHEHLLHTVHAMCGERDRNLRLFYGFAADFVAARDEVKHLRLGPKITSVERNEVSLFLDKLYELRLK